jgi:ferredoxin like protein
MEPGMEIEEKVALCAIKHDEHSHIELDPAACARCEARVCLRACPAQLYTLEDDTSRILLDHTGCLECGTCFVICPLHAVRWRYPEGSFGIRYRYG